MTDRNVVGIGGFFFRAKDPKALAEWYERFFDITQVPGDYDSPSWQQDAGETVFAPFDEDTDYFPDKSQSFMLNFRLRDLDAMIETLEAAGIAVRRDPNSPYPNGHFAWLSDPEGNPIELWQPILRPDQ